MTKSLPEVAQSEEDIAQRNISNGLDTILWLFEGSSLLESGLERRFGKKKWKALARLLQFSVVNRSEYSLIAQYTVWEYRDFFYSFDFSWIQKDFWVTLSPEAIRIFGIEFEASIIQTLLLYRIFGDILTWDFEEKYAIIYELRGAMIYQDLENWDYFLQIWKNFYPHCSIVEAHSRSQEDYFYFDAGESFYIFDVKKGILISFDEEYDAVYEVNGKHYVALHYPNTKDIQKTTLYCIEDDTEINKPLHNSWWNILKLFWFQWENFLIESSRYTYTGYIEKWKVEKSRHSVKVRKFEGQKEEDFIEQAGIYQWMQNLWEGLCIITQTWYLFEEESGKLKHGVIENVKLYDKTGEIIGNLEIPVQKIIRKIQTAQDIVYVYETDAGKIDMYSLGNQVALSHFWMIASRVLDIEESAEGCIIHFVTARGTKHFFPSADYPSTHLH